MPTGILLDLVPTLNESGVEYSLKIGDQLIPLNRLIGGHVSLTFEGEKRCVHCNRKSSKLFSNGSCWPCFQKLALNDLCVVKPHLCHYATCRQQEWGDLHCMIPTYVYLAKSSDIKVGLTRNIPGRWMDQGAVEAVLLALLPTRKMAGDLEHTLTQYLYDKTNWRRMLKGEVTEADLLAERDRIITLIPEDFRGYLLPDEKLRSFQYPVAEVPDKIASHDLDKNSAEGRLVGIKGNYLILNSGVINVPKFAGYKVTFQSAIAEEAAAG